MERGLLDKIVEAERQILAKIEAEKKKCDERLEDARRRAEERIAREKALMLEQCERAVREAEETAGTTASGILEDVKQRADRLRELPDEALQRVVITYIKNILPRESP
jgi:vacuolar-type H+-ATPase subunit H